MLEVLISIVVVSFGILAFAGLQATGMYVNNSSLLRTKATVLAYEMADRMRANQPAVASGAYSAMTGNASSPGCVSTGCTPAGIAQNDYYEWTTDLANELPGGVGVVCLDSAPDTGTPANPQCDGAGNVYAIKVWWTEKNTQYRFVTTFRP